MENTKWLGEKEMGRMREKSPQTKSETSFLTTSETKFLLLACFSFGSQGEVTQCSIVGASHLSRILHEDRQTKVECQRDIHKDKRRRQDKTDSARRQRCRGTEPVRGSYKQRQNAAWVDAEGSPE